MPTIAVCQQQFEPLAKVSAKGMGIPEFPLLIVPADFETWSEEAIYQWVDDHLEEVTSKLMGPARV